MQGPLFTYRMTAGSIVQPFFPGQPAYLSRDSALAYLGDFSGKPIQVQAGPVVRIRFDLTSYLPPALVPRQLITSVGAVLDEDNGVDAAPGSRLYGAPVIEPGNKVVHQDLLTLVPNALYVLTFSVVFNATQQKRFNVPFYTTESVVQMAVREIDTVLPITGGPITDTGPIGLQIPLAVQYGGTSGTTGNAGLDGLSNASGSVSGALIRSAGGIWSVSAVMPGAGTITSVTAGTGLTGGGSTGGVSLSLAVPVAIANGGTNATTPNSALDALSGASGSVAGHLERSSAGAWSVNPDLATPFALSVGGTGATTGFTALDSLSGVSGSTTGTLGRSPTGVWSVSAAGSGTITGVTAGTGLTGGGTSGSVTLGLSTPVSIANGGTNATTAAGALTSLGAAPIASPALTGAPTAPTPATADNSTAIATTAYVKAQGYLTGNQTITLSGDIAGSGTTAITTTLPTVNSNVGTFQGITVNAKGQVTAAANQNYAPLASPALTGTPTAPTPATADNSTAISTTAFVKAQGYAPLASPSFTGSLTTSGNYLYLAGGTGTVNNPGGPFLYADVGTMVLHLGSSNNQFVVQDSSGNAALNLIVGTGIGNGQLEVRGGYNTKPGTTGAAEGHVFNLSFPSTSATNLWIDSTNEGTIQVVVCDERVKSEMKPSTHDALAALLDVELFEYNRATHPDAPDRHERIGFSAQQLAEVIPEAIYRPDDPDEILGVQLLPIVAYLVKAVQQLTERLEASEAKLAALGSA